MATNNKCTPPNAHNKKDSPQTKDDIKCESYANVAKGTNQLKTLGEYLEAESLIITRKDTSDTMKKRSAANIRRDEIILVQRIYNVIFCCRYSKSSSVNLFPFYVLKMAGVNNANTECCCSI